MPPSLIRKGIWAAVIAVLAIVLVVAALPLAASTRIVRDRIAYEISFWSGFRVTIGATPQLEVWPSFRAILDDVTLFEWGNAEGGPVIRAERVEVDLSALAALRGDISFSKVRLVRPVLRVETRGKEGVTTAASVAGGRIALAIASASQEVAANPTNPDAASLPSRPFGRVDFSEGRIELTQGNGGSEIVEAVTGYLSWPELNKGATLSAAAVWRGEPVTVEASSEKPLVLLAGGNAPLTFGFKAKPINATFSGTANLSESHFVDGTIGVSSPSAADGLAWLRTEISPGAAIGAFSLTAQVTGSGNRFKFANTQLGLGGKEGMGSLEISLNEHVPSISGTLAFDSLDLSSFLSAFAMMPFDGNEAPKEIDTSFVDQVKLDLRLSAAEASAGTIGLTEVAATAQVQEGLIAFDISDATAFSGALQAGFRLNRRFSGTSGEFSLLASDIDTGALAAAAGAKRFLPKGPATISVLLKGDAEGWETMLDKAQGTISAKFGPGTLSGIDLAAFLKRCAQGGFFALNEVAAGSLAIDGAELKATVANGIARIDKAEAKSGPHTISVSGIIPYIGRGLALSGTVSGGVENAEDSSVDFFAGGPWSAPFISPIIMRLPARDW